MPELAAFVTANSRMGRAAFMFAVPLMLMIAVGCAALIYTGRLEAFLGYLLAVWSWLCVHANRCHDAGSSGKALVFAWPLAIIGTLMLGGAIVLVWGIGMSSASAAQPSQDPLVYAHDGIVAALALAGIDISNVRAATAVLTAAAIPLIASLLVTIPIGFAPDDPAANRWGEPME